MTRRWSMATGLVLTALSALGQLAVAAPGDQPACVTVSGTVVYEASSVLTIDIAGPNGCGPAGTDYDRLSVTDLTLNGGTLAVRLAAGYVPGGGEVFDVLDWSNALTGAFGGFDFSQAVLLNGLSWDTSQVHVSGQIAITGRIEIDSEPGLRHIVANAPAGTTARFAAALDGQALDLATPLVLSRDVTLSAANLPHGVSLDGNHVSRVIHVANGAKVTLEGITVTRGAGGNGAGIENLGGDLTLVDVTLADNHAAFYGGALINLGGTVTVTGSTFANNSAGRSGGALYNGQDPSAKVTLTNTTITGNHADGGGGGIYNYLGEVNLIHATLTRNSATNEGGGIQNAGGTVHIENSIVAGNTADVFAPDFRSNTPLDTAGANLIGDNSGTGTTFPAGPLVGTSPPSQLDAKLGPLADLGGPTPAIAPLAGSPAIDAAIVTALTPTTDQRGFARNVDGDRQGGAAPDLGAIETEPPPPPPVEQRSVPALPLALQGLLGLLLVAAAGRAGRSRAR